MKKANKFLKEWNATIEALGQGIQTILIRSYDTKHKEFLLYPSVRYLSNKSYLNSFQKEYHQFVKENALPKKDNDKIEIKYYAKVEKVIEKSPERVGNLAKNYIWTKEHVKSYLKSKKAKVWILRIYKLKEPYNDRPTPGSIIYGNLKENVSLEGIEPILSDEEFSKIVKGIESK